MVRFYVGRKQPGSTVLLSESHHVVEVPPYVFLLASAMLGQTLVHDLILHSAGGNPER